MPTAKRCVDLENHMSQFINAREAIVVEAVDGLVRLSGGRLARLDGYPNIKVVVRTDWDRSKVALVSGGGSGHEPSHAGFVGKGMLTAAVCGEVFASPSVDAVLAGILAVTGEAGCLLIVKNYTGDRLNFGLAAERARALGRKVSMVIVDDDIALPDLPQARGLAGTLFVHKIAGALAENGADLEAVTTSAKRVIEATVSIGMSLDTCTVPGSPKEDRIPAGKAELGLGIHGEPGIEQVDYAHARGAIDAIMAKLTPFVTKQPQVLLLNNLGGTSALEMSVLANEITRSSLGARIAYVIGPAAMMTSLDMRGFSVSLLPATEPDLQALSMPVGPSAWPRLAAVVDPRAVPMPEGLQPPKPVPSDNRAARAVVDSVCAALIHSMADLNALDAKAGDGDTGTTLGGAAQAVAAQLDELPLDDLPALLSSIGMTLSQVMGGSSGVLLAIFFAASGDAASRGVHLQQALQSGLARMQQIGGAKLGDRTMVDALAPALQVLGVSTERAAEAARAGAEATASMTKARSGRASYVGADRLLGNVDPGAEAVARVFESLIKGRRTGDGTV
jgi:triose/dihydroxyacetone kinase / FAD-AMP lyase (cyclizing)